MEKYTLFNGCDEWIVNFIDLKAFEESLLMNILFQSHILIHESYFFNSNLLAQHIKNSVGGISLFEVAAQHGLIVPAIRDKKAKSLREAFYTLDKQNQDSNSVLVIDEIAPYKNQIIESVDKGLGLTGTDPFYWPEPNDDKTTLGIEYLNIVRKFFQQEVPPHFVERSTDRQQILSRVWEEKKWRYDVVESAVEATKRNGNKGLQRMELLRLIGWEVGVPRNSKTTTISEINKFVRDDEKKFRAITYIKWLAQCHHLAQSIIFNTTLNFPVYNYNNDFLLDSIFINKLDDVNHSSIGIDKIQINTSLPPMEILIKLKPEELIAIRKDLGIGYIRALLDWESNPSDKTKFDVEQSVKSYCENICKRYKSELLPIIIDCERNSDELSIKTPLKEGFDILKEVTPGVKYFFQLSKMVKVTYTYFNKKKERALVNKDILLEIKNPELL